MIRANLSTMVAGSSRSPKSGFLKYFSRLRSSTACSPLGRGRVFLTWSANRVASQSTSSNNILAVKSDDYQEGLHEFPMAYAIVTRAFCRWSAVWGASNDLEEASTHVDRKQALGVPRLSCWREYIAVFLPEFFFGQCWHVTSRVWSGLS